MKFFGKETAAVCEFLYNIPDSDESVHLSLDPNPAETQNILLTITNGEEKVTLRLRRGVILQLARAFLILGESS